MIDTVIIDSREPEHIKNLTFCGAKKLIHEMEYGDVWLYCDDGQTLAIERKEPEDFIGSMFSNRLIRQASGLSQYRAVGIWPYVMVTGEMNPGPNGRTWIAGKLRDVQYAAIQGLLLNIQELGVFTYFTANSQDFEEACIRLSNRDRSDVMKLPAVKRSSKKLNSAETLLSGLPGISTTLAAETLKEAGTAARALEMMTNGEYLTKIGTNKRERIRKALGLKDGEALSIVK